MKKYLPYAIGGVVVIVAAVAAFFVLKPDTNKNSQNNDTNLKSVSISFEEPLCDQISATVVGEAIGIKIVKTEPITNSTTNVCQYYTDATHFVTLRLNKLSYETQKQGQIALDRTISTNPTIHLEHFIATQENGLINDIVLKLDDNLFIAVDRSSGKTFSEDNMLQLASAVSDYITTGVNNSDSTSSVETQVSTLDDENFIKNFFGLIENGLAADAVMVMTNKNTTDDSTKQAWAVQFNDINSVKVISISSNQPNNWTATWRQYKVVLDVVMDPSSADAPIPYYGYENGQNTRYINLVKEDGAWRIDAIATGP